MRIAGIILTSLLLLVSCTGCGTYARRNQIAAGMTKQEIARINNATPIYLCKRLFTDEDYTVYRFFLVDGEGNLRPYLCKFSFDRVLHSIELDQAYEYFALENAAGLIRSQRDMRDSEPMYWSK